MFVIGGILLLLACFGNFRCSSGLELVSLYPHGLTTDFTACQAYPRLELNTTLLMSLLNAKMGTSSSATYYSSAYMAASSTDAEADFVNMLPVPTDNNGASSNTRGSNSYFLSSNGINGESKGTVLAKKDIVSVLSMSKQNGGRRRRRRRDSVVDPSTHELIANNLVLPEDLGFPTKVRSTSGGVSTIEYCRPRGQASGLSLLPLCSMCAMTTRLPSTYFPPFVNEIYCDGSTPNQGGAGCLNLNNMDHGTCQQTTIWFSMLEAVPSKCELVTLLDDKTRMSSDMTGVDRAVILPAWRSSTYWVDGWDIAPFPVNTGCECMLHKDSFLSNSIGKSSAGK